MDAQERPENAKEIFKGNSDRVIFFSLGFIPNKIFLWRALRLCESISSLLASKKKGAVAPFCNDWKNLFTVTLTKFIDLPGSLQDVLLARVKRV